MTEDKLYAEKIPRIADFEFDARVVTVFSDMIERSVPGYRHLIAMLGIFGDRYYQPSSRCYDLGCSLGAAGISLAKGIRDPNARLVFVDNSPDMIAQCRAQLAQANLCATYETVCADLATVAIEDASIVVLNYVLQFIAPSKRLELLQRLYAGLLPGGVLLLSEKVVWPETRTQEFFQDLHYHFKRTNGYSDLEISQKRTALEKVLVPDSLEGLRERLQQAGFHTCRVWHQSLNFVSWCAEK